jgi:hypothetical protein
MQLDWATDGHSACHLNCLGYHGLAGFGRLDATGSTANGFRPFLWDDPPWGGRHLVGWRYYTIV